MLKKCIQYVHCISLYDICACTYVNIFREACILPGRCHMCVLMGVSVTFPKLNVRTRVLKGKLLCFVALHSQPFYDELMKEEEEEEHTLWLEHTTTNAASIQIQAHHCSVTTCTSIPRVHPYLHRLLGFLNLFYTNIQSHEHAFPFHTDRTPNCHVFLFCHLASCFLHRD